MRIKKFENVTQAEVRISRVGQLMVVSLFMVDGLLIDTGPARAKQQLTPWFDELEINEVILTHHHEDHTGLAHYIQETKQTPIYIHRSGIDDCIKEQKLPLYRRVFWGNREPFQPRALEGDTYKTANHTWEIIHTPGHAHDHIALYNREKGWMFGGDLFVQTTPKSMFAFESVPVLIESLRKLLTYDFHTYFCAHAGIIENGRHVIEKKLNYLERTQQEIVMLHSNGMSARAIRKKLFPKHHPIHYFSLFENSPLHIIHSVLGE